MTKKTGAGIQFQDTMTKEYIKTKQAIKNEIHGTRKYYTTTINDNGT